MAVVKLLSLPVVQERLGISRWTLYKLLNDGELGSVQVRKRRLVSEAQLAEFIERNTVCGRGAA